MFPLRIALLGKTGADHYRWGSKAFGEFKLRRLGALLRNPAVIRRGKRTQGLWGVRHGLRRGYSGVL
jgi:hypothetical protein